MRAIHITKSGGEEVLQLQETPLKNLIKTSIGLIK
jgi:hypothetical protein